MASSLPDKTQYNTIAPSYGAASTHPHISMEDELVATGLGDCAGLKILDLGGGTGRHARQAIAAGAERVDLVDISAEMLKVGQAEGSADGRIRWFEADCTKDLAEQLEELEDGYDMILACWCLDHCQTMSEYHGMWRNISHFLKPSGRIVGIRAANITNPGLYPGVNYENITEIPDGLRCDVVVNTGEPEFRFRATSMWCSLNGETEAPRRYGIEGIEELGIEGTETFRKDPEFWREFIERPSWRVFVGRRRRG